MTVLNYILDYYPYIVSIIFMFFGLFIIMAFHNLIIKIIGVNMFQISVFLMYISMGKVNNGTAPIYIDGTDVIYSNPLPHVLILTAIVVGFATTAVACGLIIRIYRGFGSIDDKDINEILGEQNKINMTRWKYVKQRDMDFRDKLIKAQEDD